MYVISHLLCAYMFYKIDNIYIEREYFVGIKYNSKYLQDNTSDVGYSLVVKQL